jgi:dTDP-glucose 4,6-dehydratase
MVYYGPRQHIEKFIPKVITNIFAGKKIPLYGNGQNIREWIYVKDHFHALMTIIEKGKPGEVYNISTNKGITNNEVLDAIFEIVGEEYRELVEHVTDRPGHDLRYAVDCTKLCRLGWSPKYDFKEALLHTINWNRANSWFLKDKKV